MNASTRVRAGAIVAGALIAMGGVGLQSQTPPTQATPSEASPAIAAPGLLSLPHATLWTGSPLAAGASADSTDLLDGMRVAIDGRGRIVAPTVRQSRELEAAVRRDRAQSPGRVRVFSATQVEHADGTVSMELDPELISYTVVQLDADGAVQGVCVDGPTAAAERTLAPVANSGREEN